ncbi:hypothetical protein DQM68_16600 [Leptospira mayottensis]|nr:hypothetical protein [Leptospira mayottensis]AXR62046.1 hypothetical protein DQM68_16600 [Leptospira mayottensis]AZQ01502.1 hypothetical protein LEP1GSC190_05105 [Leptospira mayottensis 200901116]
MDVGLTKGGFNAGLSYNSKTGSVSGNAGFTSQSGTGLALSYNEGDGFGAEHIPSANWTKRFTKVNRHESCRDDVKRDITL